MNGRWGLGLSSAILVLMLASPRLAKADSGAMSESEDIACVWVDIEIPGHERLRDEVVKYLPTYGITAVPESQPCELLARIEVLPELAQGRAEVVVYDPVTEAAVVRTSLLLEGQPEDYFLVISSEIEDQVELLGSQEGKKKEEEERVELESRVLELEAQMSALESRLAAPEPAPVVPVVPAVPKQIGHRIAGGPVGSWAAGGLGTIGAVLVYEYRPLEFLGVSVGAWGFAVPPVRVGPSERLFRSGGGGGVVGIKVPFSSSRRVGVEVGGLAQVAGVYGRLDSESSVEQSEPIANRGPLVVVSAELAAVVTLSDHARLELPLSLGGSAVGFNVGNSNTGDVFHGYSGVHVALGVRLAWVSWKQGK